MDNALGISFGFHRSSQCNHLSMVRLYTKTMKCSQCRKLGSMGWIYRCSQDQEVTQDNDLESGEIPVHTTGNLLDLLGTPKLPRPRSPAWRGSRRPIEDEIPAEQLAEYTADQKSTLLHQRDHVLETANAAMKRRYSVLSSQCKKPWVPRAECEFKICHHCRANCKDLSWLSLDAVLRDDVPATALTCFGFHLSGRKEPPVASARALRARQQPTHGPLNEIEMRRSLEEEYIELLREEEYSGAENDTPDQEVENPLLEPSGIENSSVPNLPAPHKSVADHENVDAYDKAVVSRIDDLEYLELPEPMIPLRKFSCQENMKQTDGNRMFLESCDDKRGSRSEEVRCKADGDSDDEDEGGVSIDD